MEELRSITALQFPAGKEDDTARIRMKLKVQPVIPLFLHLQTPHSAIVPSDVLGSSHQSLRSHYQEPPEGTYA